MLVTGLAAVGETEIAVSGNWALPETSTFPTLTGEFRNKNNALVSRNRSFRRCPTVHWGRPNLRLTIRSVMHPQQGGAFVIEKLKASKCGPARIRIAASRRSVETEAGSR